MELTSFTEVLAVGCEERRIISDGTEDSRRWYHLLKEISLKKYLVGGSINQDFCFVPVV